MDHSHDRYRSDSRPLPGTHRVFAAVRLSDEARVVIKRPHSRYPTPEEIATLRHEFNVLTALRAGPVPEVLDFISGPGLVGLVLARAAGRSLDVIMKDGQLDISRCVALALAAAKALAGVHAHGYVHRDVKPHHFFIDEETGRAQLIDFGLATRLPRERKVPIGPDDLQGTLPYMAPEQTGRTNNSVDRRSDLYSLGVTLYELFAGRRPFETEDALELIHAHIAKNPVNPRVHRPTLPQVLEDIVLRLLAKSPDARYRTATGLAADLQRVSADLESSRAAAAFVLGADDQDGELRIPEKLYGRKQQSEVLLDKVRRVHRGARELVLVTGAPGVGKSALIRQVQRELLHGGHFVSGKFDQYSRGVPYSALAAACGELVRVYLASRTTVLDAWKSRLRRALRENARAVIEVVPALALALGEPADIAPLPPHEAQLRFEHAFRGFLQASACEGAPLVLFLDDLQWADSASLRLLELVLASEEQGHLLVVGSYRDSEVDAMHPLSQLIEGLGPSVPIERLGLAELSRSDVQELLTDTLVLTKQPTEPLAALIFDKTSGNPFFIGQFLERLAADGQLVFEPRQGFSWDLTAIAALDATDNVVDLIVARLRELDATAQNVLRLGACIGHTFRVSTLSIVAQMARGEIVKALTPVVTGGYLLPLDQKHHLLQDLLEIDDEAALDAGYRFVHDRVQQAAVSTLDVAERGRVHWLVGSLMLAASAREGLKDEELFDVLAQLNLGREHARDHLERLSLARLNLRGAMRAKAASAHVAAIEMAATALELLGEAPFATDYETSLSAHVVLAESHFLSHDDEKALGYIDAVEQNARSVLDRVATRNLKSTIITNQGRPVEATALSVETLALLGVTLPDPQDPGAFGPAIGAAFGAYQAALGGRDVASLRDLPPMTDPEKLALVSSIAGAIPSAFQWNQNLMVLLVLLAVRLPLEHGTAAISPFFYAQYGIVHHVVTGDSLRAHEFGVLALDLARRPEHAAARGGVEFIYAEFLGPWVRPRREAIEHFREGIVAGFDAGDQLHAAYCMSVGAAEALYSGHSLTELEAQIPGYLKALVRYGDLPNQTLLTLVQRGIACLRGTTAARGTMDGDGFSEVRFEADAPPPIKAHYGALKGMLCFSFGDLEGALRVTEAITPPPGVAFKADYVFYHGMACAALALAAGAERREELVAKAEADLECLGKWAGVCPDNFFALKELLRAELHAARGESMAALDAYDAAAKAAAAAGALHYLALAHERAGHLHLRAGRTQLARVALGEAAFGYSTWGAIGKVQALRELIPAMAFGGPLSPEPALGDAGTTRTNTGTHPGDAGRLDLTSAMRAVNAIASEIRLAPLLSRLMQILVENAGATRGVLLLVEGDALKIRAALRVEPEELTVDLDEAIEQSARVASSIVHYCARTREPIVVDDAARDNRFASDGFVTEHRSKSVVCLPLVHQSELTGMLYLENDAAAGAFHAARIERLEFLAGHAAVSLKNAMLYTQIEAANESLEQRVRERTAELSERNQDMRRVLDNMTQGLLTIDLEGRLASERSRIVDTWLGELRPGTPFRDYLARINPRFAEAFAVALRALQEAILPEVVLLGQLPTSLQHGDRHFELSYVPIHGEGKISSLLVVVEDTTDARRLARDEAEQKDLLSLCRHLSLDRGGLMGFFAEARAIVGELSAEPGAVALVRRGLHTLKGNASLFGFALLAESCHAAEDAIGEAMLEQSHLDAVAERFRALEKTLASVAGSDASERIEISRGALRELAGELAQGLPASEASQAVERLLLEPVAVALGRLGEYARGLSTRLGKGRLRLEVRDHGLAADRELSAPLFAALVHLVRNAVDHGVEPPDERAVIGKATPVLTLTATAECGDVFITVEDDGRGVDWERVRELAAARGLPFESRAALTEALFAPEFSTRGEITTTSGRGAGLAALRAEVTRLGGRIELESERGRGTRFRVRLPAAALGVLPGARPSRNPSGDRKSFAELGKPGTDSPRTH